MKGGLLTDSEPRRLRERTTNIRSGLNQCLYIRVEMKLGGFREPRELQDLVCARLAKHNMWTRGARIE